MKLTSKEYVADGGNHCPQCGSHRINGIGSIYPFDETRARQDCSCIDCRARWTDTLAVTHTLTGYTALEEEAA